MSRVLDFDFLHGSWDVRNRRLKSRLVNCTEWEEFPSTLTCWSIFDGSANVDEFFFPTMRQFGLTLRVYEAMTQEWAVYWVSSADGVLQPPVRGRFHEGGFQAYGDDAHEGRPVRVRYQWSKITAVSASWDQAFSVDEERTWETNWIMDLARGQASEALPH